MKPSMPPNPPPAKPSVNVINGEVIVEFESPPHFTLSMTHQEAWQRECSRRDARAERLSKIKVDEEEEVVPTIVRRRKTGEVRLPTARVVVDTFYDRMTGKPRSTTKVAIVSVHDASWGYRVSKTRVEL